MPAAWVFLVGIAVCGNAGGQTQPDDRGNSFEDAIPIELDTSITDVLDEGDSDYFELVISSTVDVSIFTEGDTNTTGELFDSSRTSLTRNNDASASNTNFLIRGRLSPDTYYILVRNRIIPRGGTYTLIVQTDDLTDMHGNTTATATMIGLDTSITAVLHGGDVDYFALDVSSTVDVSIFTEGNTDTVGGLFDSSFTLLTFDDDESASNANFLIRGRLHPDIYYIVVRSFSAFTVGAYTLTVQTDDFNLTDIHGNTFADATMIGLDTSITAVLHGGDVDYFRIEAVSSTVDVSIFTEGNTDTAGRLYDGLFNIVAFNDDQIDSRNFRILERLYPDSDPYYIAVSGFSAFSVGEYTLRLQSENYTPFSCPSSEFNDPLYGCQWHLKNTGQSGGEAGEDINVESVWETYKGDGVHIAVVDDGLHFAHEDLKDNVYTTLNYDYTPETPLIYVQGSNHGTAVSGLIAARDENGLGVQGVAPRATIYGYNLIDGSFGISEEADAMTRNRVETDVSNNSWGVPDIGFLFPATSVWEMAIETGVNEGADGKGIVYVWSAGNGGEVGDNANYEGYTNYYAVTAVCAVDNRGIRASYSESGANLWVCAPGGPEGIVTTDNAHRYIDNFGGTSAAAPIVSGVVALVRQANPELSWRDVRLILAASARQNDSGNSGWEAGAYQYQSTSERYMFNHQYGFGVVDAQAAVDLAQDWKNVPPMNTTESAIMPVNQTIPDNSPAGVTHRIEIASDIEFIEFVEINVDFDHPYFVTLDMQLMSPSGAVSKLIVPNGNTLRAPASGPYRLGSAKHLGEDPSGSWQLKVFDGLPVDEGRLNAWSLKIYGHSVPSLTATTRERLTEQNLHGAELVLTLEHLIWEEPLGPKVFSLNGEPMGVSIGEVTRDSNATATLTLVFDGTDFDDNAEIRITALATAHSGSSNLAVESPIIVTANHEATGAPMIEGTPRVSETLTAMVGTIADDDGVDMAQYRWQWQASTDRVVWEDIEGADTETLILLRAHQDQFLRVLVRFTDDAGFRESSTSTATEEILAPPSVIILVPQAAVGSTYDFTIPDDILTELGDGVLTYMITGLPDSLSFNEDDRTINGVPESTGIYTVVIEASNFDGMIIVVNFELIIVDVGFPLVVNPVDPQNILVDTGFRFSLVDHQVFMDSVPAGGTLTYTITDKPAWLTFSANNGLFIGTPRLEDVDLSMVTVTATDTDGNQNSYVLVFNVYANIKLRLKVFLEGAQ